MTDPIGSASGRWVTVAHSSDVGRAEIAEAEGAADDLVVWRDVDGRPCVMAARCPHQWSHLAAEGVVDGDELLCTSHFWRFTAEGRGTKVNLSGRRDPKADIAVAACREIAGRIEALLPER